MSRRRRGWRYSRNLYRAMTRELAALAAPSAPLAATTDLPAYPSKPPRPVRARRPPPVMTAREVAIRQWYLYGEADDAPPAGLTDEELWRVRERFCR